MMAFAIHPMYVSIFLGMGMEAHHRGRMDEARSYYREGLKIARRMKSRQMSTVMESELAHLARESGELQQAKAAYCNLILSWKELGQFPAVAHQLESFAIIALQEGELERGARLFGAAEALREQIQIFRHAFEIAEYQQAAGALRRRMDAAAFDSAWAAGRTMNMDQAIQYAVEAGDDLVLTGGDTG